MKKSRVLLTAFAVALSLGSVSVEAKSAKERLSDEYKNVKKCMKGKCTRTEALRAARALGAAAVAAVVASKVAGKGTQETLDLAGRRGAFPEASRRRQAAKAVFKGAGQVQRPFDATIGRGAAATAAGARGLRQGAANRWAAWRAPAGPTNE